MGTVTNFNRTVIKWMKERGDTAVDSRFPLNFAHLPRPDRRIDYTSHLINGTQIYKRFDDRNALRINTMYATVKSWNSWRSERYTRFAGIRESRIRETKTETLFRRFA